MVSITTKRKTTKTINHVFIIYTSSTEVDLIGQQSKILLAEFFRTEFGIIPKIVQN
jgi:hypothetical protein